MHSLLFMDISLSFVMMFFSSFKVLFSLLLLCAIYHAVALTVASEIWK